MKKTVDIFKIPLQPYTRFHFGDFRMDEHIALGNTTEWAHSDLLFSALVNNYHELTGNAESFVEHFINDEIKISSVFYYLEKDDKTIYLLPKPVFLDLDSPRDGQHKKRNRIKFISYEVWKQTLDPSKWIDKGGEEGNDYKLIQEGEILTTKEEAGIFGLNDKSTVFYKEEHPNSPIRKMSPKQSIFYETDLHTGKIEEVEIGLYFMYEANETLKNELKRAVQVMRYAGIGGNRTVIGRTMTKGIKEATLDFDGDSLINVSLINPVDESELNQVKYFKTILRGGVVHYDVVRMIKEGALLENDIKGQLVVIGTDAMDNEALRYGKAFIIPCNLPKKQNDEQDNQ